MILILLGNLLVLIGAIFILISTIGILRLEDLFLKIHAATKAGTLGCGLLLFGVGIQIKNVAGLTEIILLIIFISITSPISAHLLGKLEYSQRDG